MKRVSRRPRMTDQKVGAEAPSKPTNTTTHTAPSPQKGGKTKKAKETEEKVPMTFTVSIGFAKKLKMLGGSLDESTSEYVESKMAPIVARDLKKVLEDLS